MSGSGRETLPEVRMWSGDPLTGRKWSGDPPEGPELVCGPARWSLSGLETLLEVRS